MKYGESAFDILYLLFAIVSGIVLLVRSRGRAERLMGMASLLLGAGDAFHLVPRVLNYFVAADFTVALGLGKLVTSITMTVFYVLLFFVWKAALGKDGSKALSVAVWACAIVRVVLCLFAQNGWLQNQSPLSWAVARNVPFIILGAIVCVLYFTERTSSRSLRRIWLYVLLSFLFYIPVAVGAGIVPALGMLMLPKTVCYILMIAAFLRTGRSGL